MMTKGEAILRLENTAWLGTYSDSVKIEEAIRMAADALKEPEIIRCKDCVHWIPFAVHPHYCVLHDWVSGADDYCSRAERRTDE